MPRLLTCLQLNMAAIVGLSSAGPIAGGIFAAAQSAAMGGSVATAMGGSVATAGGIAAAAVLPLVAVAFVGAEYADSQQHDMGEPTDVLSPKPRFVLVVHNWWHGIELREFASYKEATRAFRGGRKLRRFLVRVHKAEEKNCDNGHGWSLPWTEYKHCGIGDVYDNDMRHLLLHRLSC
jgi:hypothetical protein